MTVSLRQLGQVALSVRDPDAAEQFYGAVLGLRQLFRFGDLLFYDCGAVRLMLEKGVPAAGSVLYFRCADIVLTRAALQMRGVEFIDTPHLIAPMEDHDLWMCFFRDPDQHMLALMMEAPKGWRPVA